MEEVELVSKSNEISDKNAHPKMDQSMTSVSFVGLFSAADKMDYVLMLFGSFGACTHGAALPVFFVLFGGMIDSLGHMANHPNKMSSRISEVIKMKHFRHAKSNDQVL